MGNFLNLELFNIEIFNASEENTLRILIVTLVLLGTYSFFKDILVNLIKMLYSSYNDKKLIRNLSNLIIAFLVFRSFVELHFFYALILTPIFLVLFTFWSLAFEILIENLLENKSVSIDKKKSQKRVVTFMSIVNIFFAFLFGAILYFFPILLSFRFNITITEILLLLGAFSVIKNILILLSNVFGVNTLINLFRLMFFFAFLLNVFSHFSIIVSIISSSIWLGFLMLLPNGWKTFFLMKKESVQYKQIDPARAEKSKEYMYKLFGYLTLLTLSFIIFCYSVIPILLS